MSAPVTLKMRLGWDHDSLNAPLLAMRAEEVGVQMVTIHGRTRCQFYEGAADWSAIAAVKASVSIPVVANGDIGCSGDAAEALQRSGADAVMVGRANYGAPWTAGVLASAARGASIEIPRTSGELAAYVVDHYQEMLSFYGVQRGLRQARKHLGWYLDRHAPGLELEARQRIMASIEPTEVIGGLWTAFSGQHMIGIAA